MTDYNNKRKDFERKRADLSFLMRLLRIRNISLEEFRVIMLLFALSNDSNCVRISLENLRAAGLNYKNNQLQILSELRDKNIVLTMGKSTSGIIRSKICSSCRIKTGSKECNDRRPILFINKIYRTWILHEKPRYNENLIHALLLDNGIEATIEEINIDAQIEFQKDFEFKTEEERDNFFFKEFDDYKKNHQNK